MGGTLPALGTIPAGDIDTSVKQIRGSYNEAVAELSRIGIPVPPVPSFESPSIQSDLSAYSDEQLGNLLNQFNIWTSFVDYRLAEIEASMLHVEMELEHVKARVRVTLPDKIDGKKLTTQDKNDRVILDPRVEDAARRLAYHEAMHRITRAVRDNFQKTWETVSRRITQRGQEVERIKRDHSVAGIPTHHQDFRRPQFPPNSR